MDDEHFGERVAARYDETEADRFAPKTLDPTVALLEQLAAGGRALELGIGTGRVALALRGRGVPVVGIDRSVHMAARLVAKPGGDAVPVVVGDMATTRVEGTFRLVYVVFNTIMNLTTQEAQLDCVRNAAAHLEAGGAFLVEVMVPALSGLASGSRRRVFALDAAHIGIDEYDVATQHLVSHHYRVLDGRLEVEAIPFRYVWPSELDLMARAAGLRLEARWGGWNREPFSSDSSLHVSLWRKDDATA